MAEKREPDAAPDSAPPLSGGKVERQAIRLDYTIRGTYPTQQEVAGLHELLLNKMEQEGREELLVLDLSTDEGARRAAGLVFFMLARRHGLSRARAIFAAQGLSSKTAVRRYFDQSLLRFVDALKMAGATGAHIAQYLQRAGSDFTRKNFNASAKDQKDLERVIRRKRQQLKRKPPSK